MKLLYFLVVALAGCSTIETVTPGTPAGEVVARFGTPVAQGKDYRDYSREPYGYYRVSFGPDERVHDVRNLHTAENFAAIKPGMTQADISRLVGVPTAYLMQGYPGGASSWTYRYRDAGIAKLLYVEFDPAGSVLRHSTEWDPDVYSKGGARNDAR